jgi:hypothetical protein
MVVIMVGSVCEGTLRALTQEAAVCSATEPLGNPAAAGRGRREGRAAAHGGHATDLGGRS